METQIQNIYETLKLNKENGLFVLAENNLPCNIPLKTKEFISNSYIKPTSVFLFNNEPLILFYESPLNKEKLFKDIWNFNQTPIIFIIENNQIEIYNGFNYLKNNKALQKIELNENEFVYDNLITGTVFQKYSNTYFKNKNRVDQYLLNNIKNLRDLLINYYNLPENIINNLIGRTIFIRYLIDRKIKIKYRLVKNDLLTNEELCKILETKSSTYSLFKFLKLKFNGNLFPILEEEEIIVNENILSHFIDLLKGNDISSGQSSLFDIYDFSIIPIELISSIYESFIGENKRSEKGAFYTPLFLVNYVIENTISKYFKTNNQKIKCAILDPACGSGIFLVEALRRIINNYQAKRSVSNFKSKSKQKILKKLLTDNIYGIDSDSNAINVAIFSLYITLLDYIDPPDISSFKFPKLLNTNFFCADFFDEDSQGICAIKKINFNFIIGNPPWGNLSKSNNNYLKYTAKRELSEGKKISVSNKEIAECFLIRVSDFMVDNCAFIVTSKILYNKQAKKYRKYFLGNFKISQILELSSVREYIFDSSINPPKAPAIIMFYTYSPDINVNRNSVVNHISLKPNRFFQLFKLMLIEKYDNKNLFQKYFIDYDWIWKTLVYGSILDFNFVKRLKGYDTLNKLIGSSEKNILPIGRGIDKSQGNHSTKPIMEIENYVDVENNGMKAFQLSYTYNYLRDRQTVSRLRNPNIYKAPMLLVKSGVESNNLNIISAISLKDTVFSSSVYSIKINSKDLLPLLKLLCGIFNSDFFLYFCISVSTSIGIERKRILEEDLKDLPVNFKMVGLTKLEKRIELLVERLSSRKEVFTNTPNMIPVLNKSVNRLYDLSELEQSLIEYQMEITRPLIASKDYAKVYRRINFEEYYLEKYSNTFIKHFEDSFSEINKGIDVQILYDSNIICLLFKVVDKQKSGNIIWMHENVNSWLRKTSPLLYKKINKDIYIQKDIKGFEEDSFYIIKPNEYKSWHKAVSYLDLNEITDSLIKSGLNNI